MRRIPAFSTSETQAFCGLPYLKEENEKDVRCIAAPIRNYQGRVVAAVSVSSPAYRVNKKNQDHLQEELIATCQKISSRLGYMPNNKNI